MTLKSVDLPAPFGPIRPVIEPSAISIEAPSTARMPPKCMWRSSTRIMRRLPVAAAGPRGPAAGVAISGSSRVTAALSSIS